MKGVKYNLKMACPNEQFRFYNGCDMETLIKNIKEHLKQINHIEMKITNHIVYNLIKRKEKSNGILRNMCFIQKV